MEIELVARMSCQWLVVFIFVVGFMSCAHTDFNGHKHSEPLGFDGFIATCFLGVSLVFVLWGAGAFDVLFGG